MGKNVIAPAAGVAHIKPFEKVFADRVAELPLDRIMIYLIDTVPASALPYLAEQFNVLGLRGWKYATTETRQRALLKKAIALQRIEGTEAAVLESLKIIGINNASILHPIPGNTYNGQWSHNGTITYGGAYHWACFKVLVDFQDLLALPPDVLDEATALINEWKNVRSKLIGIDVFAPIDDSAKPSDSISIEVTANLNEQIGPITYDGSANYDGSATHNGSYDEVDVALDGDPPQSVFKAYFPALSTATVIVTMTFSGLVGYELDFGGTDSLTGIVSEELILEDYVFVVPAGNPALTIKLTDPSLLTTIRVSSDSTTVIELTAQMNNLEGITAQQAQITEFIRGSFTTPALNRLFISKNQLPVSEVNSILVWLLANGVNDGAVEIGEQTPPAPPTGAGLAAAGDLVDNGWTVLTD